MTNTTAIFMCIKVLEETIFNARIAVSAATDAGSNPDQNFCQPVSLPAVILEKEMAKLMSSLKDLKNTAEKQIVSTLQSLNKTLSAEAAAPPIEMGPDALEFYNQYWEMLLRSIIVLKRLEKEVIQKTYSI